MNIEQLIDEVYDLEELRRLIRIDTRYDASTISPDTPYGQGIAEGLAFLLG